MSKEKFNNNALQLQLRITSEISELLKNRGINITSLNVDLKTFKAKKKAFNKADIDIVKINGKIIIEINSRLNPDKSVYNFDDESEEDDELLEDDYITK